ncbi:MAG TPA: RidA family protein [Verrucomicrobiae bacterium]|nr:RidA family protein [Verrucomicrobiae bacterium]
MTKTIVKPSQASAPGGPYSHGVRVGDLLFCAGQIPLVPESGHLMAGDIRAQTQRVLENIGIILQDQGLSFKNVVKTTVFLTNLADFASMNETYERFFVREFPARTTIQVAALPRDAAIEIEAIAHY